MEDSDITTIKLEQYLQQQNVERIRDFLLYMNKTCLINEGCPVDLKVVIRAIDFLKPYYQVNEAWKFGDPSSSALIRVH